MRVCVQTRGPTPKAGGRVLIDGLHYLVTSVEEPTDLDDEISITECDVQPTDGGSWGPSTLKTKLVKWSKR